MFKVMELNDDGALEETPEYISYRIAELFGFQDDAIELLEGTTQTVNLKNFDARVFYTHMVFRVRGFGYETDFKMLAFAPQYDKFASSDA